MKNNLQNKATVPERKKYVLSTRTDLEILAKCKQLEKRKLSATDKQLVKLIKTQLIRNWRKPLLAKLQKLLKKYQNR